MMSRDSLFTVALLLVVGWAVWEGRVWPLKAQLFPWMIGFPLLVLLLIQLGLSLRAARRPVVESKPDAAVSAAVTGTAATTATVETDAEAGAEQLQARKVDPAMARRRLVAIVAWLLGFAGAIVLLGFPIGGTLMTFAYLKIAGREGWGISLGVTAGAAAFFWATVRLLNVPYPQGLLLDLLGL